MGGGAILEALSKKCENRTIGKTLEVVARTVQNTAAAILLFAASIAALTLLPYSRNVWWANGLADAGVAVILTPAIAAILKGIGANQAAAAEKVDRVVDLGVKATNVATTVFGIWTATLSWPTALLAGASIGAIYFLR